MHIMDSGQITAESSVARYTGSGSLQAELDAWATRVQGAGAGATDAGGRRLTALEAVGL